MNMRQPSRRRRIEYGDFQTPSELARQVCQKLIDLGVQPDAIVEPTCGLGAFVEASARAFPAAKTIIGLEINPTYLAELEKKRRYLPHGNRILLLEGDFFTFDWHSTLSGLDGLVLVIGNFPWVTNSQQGVIGGANLPDKVNFQNHTGLDAITGRSNFDISEWMLLQTAKWLQNREGYLAMLCKTAVARKFLSQLHSNRQGLSRACLYGIDAKKYFGAAVDACLLFCEFEPSKHNTDYDVYESLGSPIHHRAGHRQGLTVRDLDAFERLSYLRGDSGIKWRSGIKHDCAEVMELQVVNGTYINGLGELVDIETLLAFPLVKGSDVANGRVNSTARALLVTQKTPGEPTALIKHLAPKTWAYLEAHARHLDRRKSRIYKSNPRFSIFGVGPYTFAAWKIAICGLYKGLDFRLVGPIDDRPVVFDDTVYFLSFDSQEEARHILGILNSDPVQAFLESLIFWDEKRPIKASILNSLDLRGTEKTYTPTLLWPNE